MGDLQINFTLEGPNSLVNLKWSGGQIKALLGYGSEHIFNTIPFFFWSELLKYWHDNCTSDVLVDYQSWPAVAIVEHYFYAPTFVNTYALKLVITVNEELSSFKRKK